MAILNPQKVLVLKDLNPLTPMPMVLPERVSKTLHGSAGCAFALIEVLRGVPD